MDDENEILLSIGIPTYNRAKLLQSALLSLVPQVQPFKHEVEVIVSDNNSSDNTPEIVQWAQQFGEIRYFRNDKNIGACNNVLQITNQYARGKYCWILGDDDFVRPSSITKIVEILKKYQNIDYVYVNIAHFSTDLLEKFPHPVSSAELPDDLPLGNKDPNEYYVERWERLINPNISEIFLGALMTAIVKTSLWKKFSTPMMCQEQYSSLDTSYPQFKIFGQGLYGKPAYYIGSPLIVVIDGAREWNEYIPLLVLKYLHEGLDYYLSLGVNGEQIEECRRSLVTTGRQYLKPLLSGKKSKGLENFPVGHYILKYWRYLGLIFIFSTFPLLVRYFFNNWKNG